MALTHYIIVRRDLPLGVVCAQVTHAAGESYAAFVRDDVYKRESDEPTSAVVLGVKSERQLKNLEKKLKRHHVKHFAMREPDAPWLGQLMAIGLWPTERDSVTHILEKYNLIQTLL
jgi:peptidyl-tRNA hydrolase